MDSDPRIKRECFALGGKECANCYDGWCLPIDCPCFVYAPNGWVCTYFLDSVLPRNPPLLATVREKIDGKLQEKKKCVVCGNSFIPGSNRQRYCQECSREAAREKHARRSREYRARSNA